jgi:hypothetical protein
METHQVLVEDLPKSAITHPVHINRVLRLNPAVFCLPNIEVLIDRLRSKSLRYGGFLAFPKLGR